MADPLSMASAIAGLVALTDLVFTKTLRYVRQVKSAEKSIKDLVQLLQSMSGTLHVLKQRLLVFDAEPLQHPPCLRPQILKDCAELLEDVNRGLSELDKTKITSGQSHSSSKLQKFKWPFDARGMNDLVNQLTRFNDVLNTALTADTLIAVHESFQMAGQLREDIKQLERSMSAKLNKLTVFVLNQEQNDAVDYFRSSHAVDMHKTATGLRQNGTGKWFTESDELCRWFDGRDPNIWLSGIPGAGKTILASAIIDKAKEASLGSDGKIAFAFYYCDYKDSATHSISNILKSLIAQIAVCNQKSLTILVDHYLKFCKPGQVSPQGEAPSLLDLIRNLMDVFERTLIVVDGLDECGNNVGDACTKLSELGYGDASKISTLFVSRSEVEIKRILLKDYIHIPIAARNTDLKLYVYAQIDRRTSQGTLFIDDPDIRAKIIERLVDSADGMFRWVACQVDYLCELATDFEREEALNDLPPDLNSTYERILQRINKKPPSVQRLVRRTLQWLIFSEAPLTVLELQEALCIEEGDSSLQTRRRPNEDIILHHCSSLIRRSNSAKGPVLEPAHFTVKEYLKSISAQASEFVKFRMDEESSNLELANACLLYLNLDDFGQPSTSLDSQQRLAQFPFRTHAVSFWVDYASTQHHDKRWFELVKKLLMQPITPNLLSWIHDVFWLLTKKYAPALRSPLSPPSESELMSPSPSIGRSPSTSAWKRAMTGVTALHCASILGIPMVVEWLLESGMNANAESVWGRPIHCAILGIGAMVNAVFDSNHHVADNLDAATVDTLRILVKHNADASKPYQNVHEDHHESTLGLIFSAPRPNMSILRDCIMLALAAGARLDADTGELVLGMVRKTPDARDNLLKCFEKKHVEPSYLCAFLHGLHSLESLDLLKHFGCFETTLSDQEDGPSKRVLETYLRLLSQFDQVQAVEELLKIGIVDIDGVSEVDGSTALHFASAYGSYETAKVLLTHGAKMDVQNMSGQTPLHVCADTPSTSIAELLLLNGAAPYLKDQDGDTPWSIAALWDHVEILRVWYSIQEPREDRFVNRLASSAGPLFRAMSSPSPSQSSILFLASNETYANVLQDDGRNLAHYCRNLTMDTFQTLRKRGLKLNVPDCHGQTPLHVLAGNCYLGVADSLRHEAFLKILVAEGCDVNGKCSEGNTPLHYLLENPSSVGYPQNGQTIDEFCAFLDILMTDENKNVCNNNGKTPLDVFVERHWSHPDPTKHLDILLRRGTDFGPDRRPFAYVANEIVSSGPKSVFGSPTTPYLACFLKLLEIAPDVSDTIDRPLGVQISLWAAEHREQGLLLKLLDAGVDCTKQGVDDNPFSNFYLSLIDRIILCDHPKEIYERVLLSVNDADLMTISPFDHYTYLHRLCSPASNASAQLLEALLKRGLAIDATSKDGSTPLLLAARHGKPDHFRILTEHNADLKATYMHGWGVLQLAVRAGHIDIVKYLLTKHKSALQVESRVIHTFACPVSQLREEGCQIIHLSIYYPEILTFLLDALPSLDIETPTNSGDTPLHIASAASQESTVKLLIKQGANTNVRNTRSWTPLHAAVWSFNHDIVKILCENGAEVDSVSDEGATPLHYAAKAGYIYVVEELLKAGASTTKTWRGSTPEDLAREGGHVEIVDVLARYA